MNTQAPSAERRARIARHLAGRTVVVVSGGRSSEREISLQSGTEMLRALTNEPASLESVQAIEIEPDGRWRHGTQSLSPAAALELFPSDAIFLLGLHGGEGENGSIQGLFEVSNRLFTASGVEASARCMNKHATNELVASEGIRCAPGLLISEDAWSKDREALLAKATTLTTTGWFVKPNSGGSSVATSSVDRLEDLEQAVEEALATGDHALVEARIEGIECSCGVIGNHGDELVALPPIEIRPHEGRFFDYEEKYSETGALEICPPESFSHEVSERVRELSILAHRTTGCDGYSRVDFIVPTEGDPVFLEVNTLPGFTARSLFPQEGKVVGLEFADLLHEILALAVERFERAQDDRNH